MNCYRQKKENDSELKTKLARPEEDRRKGGRQSCWLKYSDKLMSARDSEDCKKEKNRLVIFSDDYSVIK